MFVRHRLFNIIDSNSNMEAFLSILGVNHRSATPQKWSMCLGYNAKEFEEIEQAYCKFINF